MSETGNDAATDTAAADAVASRDAQEGKILALLSYIFGIVALVPLIQRNNAFALYHAKQVVTLFVAAIGASIALRILGFVLPSSVSLILSFAFMVAMLGLVIIGVLNSWNCRARPLPIIGAFAERLFGGITVK
jgi:uncharacterized membrane protein